MFSLTNTIRNNVLANVVSCCKHCNIAKNNRTLSEFKEWASRLSNFLKEH